MCPSEAKEENVKTTPVHCPKVSFFNPVSLYSVKISTGNFRRISYKVKNEGEGVSRFSGNQILRSESYTFLKPKDSVTNLLSEVPLEDLNITYRWIPSLF